MPVDDGVATNPVDIAILGNSIHSNAALGIDLSEEAVLGAELGGIITLAAFAGDGVSPNDNSKDLDECGLGPNDSGCPNNLQNFPKLNSATGDDDELEAQGELNSEPGKTYRIDFYLNDEVDASGNGEGQTPLGFILVDTDASGSAGFDVELERGDDDSDDEDLEGDYLTATATEMVDDGQGGSVPGSTSEFSAAIQITDDEDDDDEDDDEDSDDEDSDDD